MPVTNAVLLIAVVAFVAGHFLMSHTWRKPLIAKLGQSGFTGLYTAVAVVLLGLVGVVYHFAPHGPALWDSDNAVLQLAFGGISYVATVLFLGSLGNNPTLVGATLSGLSTRLPTGTFLITRHPMMFAIAALSAAVILLIPSTRDLIGGTGMIVLALVGARLQDKKKLAQSHREYNPWVKRTRFWPDLRQAGALGLYWIIGVPVWLLMTWVLMRATFMPCGVWYFFPSLNG